MRRWTWLSLLALAAARIAAAQAGQIAGTVTAETGQPLPNVAVLVVGSARGATTNASGRYTITGVPDGTHQVTARMFGFVPESRTVVVSGSAPVTADFRLVSAPAQLTGVVVVGYGTQERERVTGAVSTVNAQQLREVPTANPIQAIQGRVPGVEVVAANSLPGAGMNIRVRGIRSLTASNDPLYVVDGIPLSGGIQDFNPADIETISILKDASATAIYGARAANGVVLLTTKSGAASGPMKTSFAFDSYYGAQRPRRLIDMMNAKQYVQYLRDAAAYAGVDTSLSSILTPSRLVNYKNGVSTDWQRELLRTGQQRNVQLGMSGSNGPTRFRLSGNAFDQSGLTAGEAYNRAAGIASIDHTLQRLRLGITANGARSVQDIGAGDGLWGIALAQTPFGTPYDSNGVLIPRPDDEPLQINPIANQQNFIRQVTRNRIFASAFSELNLMPGLAWRVNFGPDITTSSDGTFAGSMTNDRNLGTPRGSYNTAETFAYTLDNLLQLTRDIGTAHHFDATALYSWQKQRSTSNSVAATDLPYDQQLWYNLGTGTVQSQSSGLSEFALKSYMGRMTYSLLSRYTVTATGRYDGSSVLAPGNKWAFFPSVGLAWNVGDEAFMHRLPLFTALKLRGSWGLTGNSSVAPYQTEGTLSSTKYDFGTANANGFRPGSIPNPSLKWEKTEQTDIGVEYGIFDDRVTGTIDWYRQNTRDLLMNRALPATSGYTQTLQNIGATRNTGVEVAVSAVTLRNWRGLHWNTDVNFAHNHNEIVSLANGVTADLGNGWFVGQPININSDGQRRVWFDYQMAGVWQTADSALARKYGFKPGQIRIADVNNDGKIDANDRVILGNTYAKWTASIYNRLTWRSLDVSGLATAKIGYMFFDDFGSSTNNLQGRFGNIVTDYWTPTNPSNTQPAPGYNGNPVIYGSTRAYTNGSHWRIRNITAGYTVPPRYLGRINANGLRVYATAQDPYVFTSYKGYDPENGTNGGAPAYRTLLLGANLVW